MAYTQVRINAALDGANAGITHAQLHIADPGPDGLLGVAQESSRVAIALPGAAVGSSQDQVQFTITGAEGPYTFVSLWDDPAAGTYYGSGALSPAESFGGPGTLDVTVTTTAAAA